MNNYYFIHRQGGVGAHLLYKINVGLIDRYGKLIINKTIKYFNMIYAASEIIEILI